MRRLVPCPLIYTHTLLWELVLTLPVRLPVGLVMQCASDPRKAGGSCERAAQTYLRSNTGLRKSPAGPKQPALCPYVLHRQAFMRHYRTNAVRYASHIIRCSQQEHLVPPDLNFSLPHRTHTYAPNSSLLNVGHRAENELMLS